MPVPSPRNPILPARGNYADLLANVAALSDGEICYAIDQDTIYMKEGSSLVAVGSSGGAVTSVAGKTGDVTLVKADITDFSDSDYATGAEGDLAATATQPGDNVSTLTNDAGYLTSVPSQELDDLTDVNAPTPSNGQFLQWNGTAWVPGAASGAPVDSVNGQTGIVVLDADDISDTATTNKFATQTELDKLAGIEAGATADQTPAEIKIDYESNLDTNAFTDAEKTKLAGVAAGAEVNAVDSVAGKTGDVTLVKADITDFSDADYATAAQGALADSATQPGDNISTLTNDAGYITAAQVPADAVQSINGQTGVVVLNASDVGAATTAQGTLADSAVQPNDNVSTLTNDAGYITDAGVTQIVAGTNITISPVGGTGAVTIDAAGGGGGTVSSVGFTAPTGFSVSGSPITTSGTIDLSYAAGYQGYTSAEASKLAGVADGAEVNVNADWNATSGDAQILNKPTLGTAAALDVGTTAGTVAAGDDARFAVQDIYVIACSDEETELTTGTAKATFRMGTAGTLTKVKATVTTAPVGSDLIVDINEAGTSVLSTKLSIDDGEKTSETAATPPVISDSALADDAEITIDIDQVGSSPAGAGLKVTFYITRS